MAFQHETARIIRIFVSSAGDVQEERAVLEKAVECINRTDGHERGVRLELWKWESDVVPQIGPKPQTVVDEQTPTYDIYLRIMSTRFGTPTDDYGSGTEKEFRDALEKWKGTGEPWITFYFNAKPELSAEPEDGLRYVEVCKFRKELEEQGIVATYTGIRGSDEAFYDKVSGHLRKLVYRLAPSVSDTKQSTCSGDAHLTRESCRCTSNPRQTIWKGGCWGHCVGN